MSNLAPVREALGPPAAVHVLRDVRAALGDFVELPDEQVVHAGDDCFLIWLPEGGDRTLEELLVRISSRPVQVEGHAISLLAQAGWTALQCEQPRELLPEEINYVLFTSASSTASPRSGASGDRFLVDMEVASHVMAALDDDRIGCQWQGISGLYGGNSFLYWRGMAQPDTPQFGAQFALSQGFMPALERLNLTRALDRHMALRVLGQLISMPALRLACRISSLSVQNDHYWQHLLSTLAAYPAAARRFTLEISGQVPLPSREAARAFCASVRELGAHIALANFGCGPVNLADMQACQPRTLLLDEGFALRCRHHAEEKIALRDMVRICAGLAEQVVVTGVNDEEAHSDALRAGARWICGDHVNPAPPFASRFWRSARGSEPLYGPRAARQISPGRPRPEDGDRVDWRSPGLDLARRYMQ